MTKSQEALAMCAGEGLRYGAYWKDGMACRASLVAPGSTILGIVNLLPVDMITSQEDA